jgi:hypothetical protein
MARAAASAVAAVQPVQTDMDWRDIAPLPEADTERAYRLGYKECWMGADGLLHITASGSGSLRLALLEGRFLPVLRERDPEDGIWTVRPLVFSGLSIRPIDGRMIEITAGSETHVVAADRWLRRLAARIPRVIRARLGKALVLRSDVALQAAQEVRIKE